MKRTFWCLLSMTLVLLAFNSSLEAQVNPNTVGILNGTSSSPSTEDQLSSTDRYKVVPRTEKKEKEHVVDYEKSREMPPKKEASAAAKVVPELKTEVLDPSMNSKESPIQIVSPEPKSVVEEQGETGAGLFQHARDLVIGGSPKDLNEYRNFLSPDDERRNMIELQVAPIMLYNDSNSSYWYRSYSTFSPGFYVKPEIWFTHLFGLTVSYKKTIGASINGDHTGTGQIAVTQEWLTAGLQFRRYFGLRERAPSFTFGLEYREYNFKVPADEALRIKIKSTGPRMTAKTKVPSSARYTWIYDLEVTPYTKQSESGSNFVHQSGTGSDTFGYGLGIGGEYKMDRGSRMYYRFSYFLERTLFSGAATRVDPNSGTTPENVPVNNSFTMFELGYIWGK